MILSEAGECSRCMKSMSLYFSHGFEDPMLSISVNTKDGSKRTLHCLLLSELPIKISPVNAKRDALFLKLSKMALADVVALNE